MPVVIRVMGMIEAMGEGCVIIGRFILRGGTFAVFGIKPWVVVVSAGLVWVGLG